MVILVIDVNDIMESYMGSFKDIRLRLSTGELLLPRVREKRQTRLRRRTDLIIVDRVRSGLGGEAVCRSIYISVRERMTRHFDCVQFNVNDISQIISVLGSSEKKGQPVLDVLDQLEA